MHELEILAIIWVSVFLASWTAHVTRLTPVLWFLFFGALFVNVGILPEVMPEFITVFAELGIIIIMFALGFEEDTSNFVRSIKRSWGIALFGALAPFSVTFFLTMQYWGDFNVSLMCGLAMTATAVSLTLVSLKTEGLGNTPAATGIMTSAVLDDIASLALVAILVPVATGSEITIGGIGLTIVKAIVFFLGVVFIGGWLFPSDRGLVGQLPIIGEINLRRILAMGRGEYTVLSLLLIGLLMGLLSHLLGFHAAVGAYMAGLVIRREYFDFDHDRDRNFHSEAHKVIDNVAFSWIGPVFFVVLGTKLKFDAELLMRVIGPALLLFVGMFIGQVLSAALAAKYTGKFDWPDSWMIGFGMLGRAELAFVVLEIAYVDNNIMSEEAFYTLMVTIFLLNCSVPLTIRWWKSKYGDNDQNNRNTGVKHDETIPP